MPPPPVVNTWVRGGLWPSLVLKLGGMRRRTNHRAPPLNQSHLHTLPMARWSMVLMATLISILMLPPTSCEYMYKRMRRADPDTQLVTDVWWTGLGLGASTYYTGTH